MLKASREPNPRTYETDGDRRAWVYSAYNITGIVMTSDKFKTRYDAFVKYAEQMHMDIDEINDFIDIVQEKYNENGLNEDLEFLNRVREDKIDQILGNGGSILKYKVERMLQSIGVHEDEFEFHLTNEEDLEEGIICEFYTHSIDSVTFQLTEDESNEFTFKIEYDGGYTSKKRVFSDMTTLNYHLKKIKESIEFMFKINNIHNHLYEDTEVNREVSLQKIF